MYTKTQWVDNTTPIDKDNLNKIEQGIYDNSLVVDAVTNTINPTDTETYKTAEITEGQITDAIGVNDILIKGQTSQNGEPTPSSPVDVNVVSGSNVINTSNKNLLNINNAIAFRACTIQLQNNSIKIITDGTNNAIVRIPCVLTAGNYYLHFEGNTNIINVAFYNSNEEKIIASNPSSSKAITLSDNLAYININLSNVAGTYTLAFNKLYINLGSTDLSYEPHQGKELPLDLPVKNLFDVNVSNASGTSLTNNGITLTYKDGYINLKGTATAQTDFYLFGTWSGTTSFINLKAGQYITSITTSNKSIRFYINKTSATISVTDTSTGLNTFTLNENTNVTSSFIRIPSGTKINENVYLQLAEGSKANAYTPYGTEPIELCKIGNYQDYFYKSGSKWYLHKEVEKIVLNGTENWIDSISQYGGVALTGLLSSSPNIALSNILKYQSGTTAWTEDGKFGFNSSGVLWCKISNTINSLNDWKTYLNSNNMTIYYHKYPHTDTEITGTLKEQLEAIYNAPLYEQTNITQTNNDLPMVLDITACKDNINGIKAFIRK